MPSLRATLVRMMTGAWFAQVDAQKADVRLMRQLWHGMARFLWTARGVDIEKTEVAGRPAEWLRPPGARDDSLLLYLHGGAYVMGDCATHRQLVSYLARGAGVSALIPEYRLAPEHPFPAAVEDAVGVYRALLADGHPAGGIVVAGDSAGGGLTMATLLSLRDAGDPLPAGACLLSPWLDLTASGESMTTRAASDPWFRPEDIPFVAAYYCRPDELRNPLASPVFGDLSGLPPTVIQVGGDEILLSDSTRAAEKLRDTGGDVEIEIWPGMWHVFQAFVHLVPESRDAVRKLAGWIRRRLAVPPPSEA